MSNSQDPASRTGVIRRGWAAWCRFWFLPSDPTPLCLMRIVTGLLMLYLHVAYTFDLHALFGGDGWYPVDQALRERREWPVMTAQWKWPRPPFDTPEPRFRMPPIIEHRRALRAFIDNLARNPEDGKASEERAKALELLKNLPDDPELRILALRFLQSLPTDFADRDAILRDMVKAPSDDPDSLRRFGRYFASMSERGKEIARQQIHALYDMLPAEKAPRIHVFTVLTLQVTRDINEFARFVEHVAEVASQVPKDQRDAFLASYLEYCERWTVPPDDPELVFKGHNVYSPFYHITSRTGVNIIHGLHLFVIFLFTIGLFTRVTAVLTWLSALAYIHRNPLTLFGMDTMMNLCIFYLMFAPCGATWSVDWLLRRYRAARRALASGQTPPAAAFPQPMVSATFVIRLLQIQYCLMYFSAGVSKLKGESWWNGTAVWYTMTNPEFSPLHIETFRRMVVWLCQDNHRIVWELYMNITVIGTLILEIGFPFLVWTRMRPIMIAAAVLLHTGIALNMGLIVFGLFMFTLLLAWMPPAVIRKVFAKKPAEMDALTVRFDNRDPKQVKAAAATFALDVWGQAALQDRAEPHQDPEPLEVVSAKGDVTTGNAAARLVAQSLAATHSFAWISRIPGLGWFWNRLFSSARPLPRVDAHRPVGTH